jgi:hypothetical protein
MIRPFRTLAALGFAVAVAGSFVFAADPPAKDKSAATAAPAGQPEMKLPPGWTMDDMKACMLAGTPGKQHEFLAKAAGNWAGKSTLWMAPGGEPARSDVTMTITPVMDGHYVRTDFAGDMPGMGPYRGMGINGFDNVAQKFVSTWIDNQNTGIMTGTGELSADGKTLSWNYTYNCPINKRPAVMREIDTVTGPTTRTLEMWGTDPKSGKDYKMMFIELTKK